MILHRSAWLMPILLGLLLGYTGCKSLYVPNQAQVPLMSEGDETQVALNVASNGYGLQLAYSPYYHWAVIANGNTFTVVQDTNFEIKYRHSYAEIGTGYYTRLTKYIRTEVLFGIGGGSSGLNTSRSIYRRGFLQPSIGMSGKIIDAGITPRFAWVQHFQDRIGGTRATVNESAFFFEPILTLRLGMEQVKFQLQGGMSLPLGNAPFSYRQTFGSIGIHLTFVKDFDKYDY